MSSFKFYFSDSDVTYLTIYLNDQSIRRLSFNDKKNPNNAITELSIFSIFYYFVSQYNRADGQDAKISMEPGFFAIKFGEYVIYVLVMLDIVAISFYIILRPGTSIFSFIGLF